MKFIEYTDQCIANGIVFGKNKSKIEIHSPFATKTDVLNVDPLSVKCDTLRFTEDAEYEAIKWAIDFDKWKHSYHNEIKPENYEHFLEIIQGKVIEKSEQLCQLNSVAIFLINKIEDFKKHSPELLEPSIKNESEYEPF